MVILAVSVFVNYKNGQDLLGTKEFILIGFLVFLVIGDEIVKFKASKDGIEIDNSKKD